MPSVITDKEDPQQAEGQGVLVCLLFFFLNKHSCTLDVSSSVVVCFGVFSPLFKFFKILLIFRERGREGEREGKKHWYVVASCMPPTGEQACNPGMYPDWKSNWQIFGSQAGTQSTEPYKPGLLYAFFMQTCHKEHRKKHELFRQFFWILQEMFREMEDYVCKGKVKVQRYSK